MNEELTFEAIKEILPELEAKLRVQIQAQYRLQINRISAYYQKLSSQTIMQKQHQYKQEMQKNQSQLRKQLSIIQRERQQWLTLQNNYRKTIMQLTQRLRQTKAQWNISALTEITPKNPQLNIGESQQKVGVWKKKRNSNNTGDQIFQNNAKIDSTSMGFQKLCNSQAALEKKGEYYFSQKQEENLLEERPLKITDTSDSKFKNRKNSTKIPNQSEFKQRSQRQDTMVLSPPKQQERARMKSSFIDPPNTNTMKGSILKNEQGKKKLLQLIRNIK